ncbi:NADH-quinone oxidoreductase subunit E [Pseudaminobacter arsenicus]|uniref:NADH-quinone oxidoreductase subunit E n=1 Tax=Borborobacter arsenicus TaxID=1851146 RepID=A0A432VC23_9HYPH|nr:NADH-quinone oxidoreductase subunit E [Pseudaminobacter arsenicus]RUM99695.1 NADH-quinone oxidoreductase subunit E [Pseudaminobacter arsenicus]
MSVRRLAETDVQPASFVFSRAMAAQAKTWIKKYPKGREQSAVIPLLMLAQEQEGWVTRAAIEHVAEMLDMPLIRVLEVATFYTQFQLQPVGTRAHIQVCGTTPCMLRGAEALMDVCRSKIHHDQFHTNETGTLSWEEVECQGACVNAPMIMIFKDAYEDLTPERLAEIIDLFEAGKGDSVKVGPQVDRIYSAPQAGLTSLQDEKAVLKSTREAEAKAAAKAAKVAATGAVVPPSKAAKPKTHAMETNGTVKSPSPVKAGAKAEKKQSAAAPVANQSAANKAEQTVEAVDKQRKGAASRHEPASAFKSPERLKGEPIGAGGRKVGAVAKPSLDDKNRPAGIDRPALVDDLKLISGVGPKNESILHSLGIFTFAQIAAWKKAEREWVDAYLNFKGRIEREDWSKQAKALAKGGVAEYIRVFGKKPV